MQASFSLKRTTTADPDFQLLVAMLDRELWDELKEDQATYDQYNKVPDIKTAVLIYAGADVVACGCFKPFEQGTVEIKRMFVTKPARRRGLSRQLLTALEQWAIEDGFTAAVLETSIRFNPAIRLYQSAGYSVIPNYGQYQGLSESVCMKKQLQ